jgi:hypothetical protein
MVPLDPHDWQTLKRTMSDAFASSLHFAIASVDADGAPRVTPVGTVFLNEPGHAHYFELYATGLGRRLSHDPRVSVLAVDSGKVLWLQSLLRGRFQRTPAVRLVGVAARETRLSTAAERARLGRRLGPARYLPGGRILWPDLEGEAASTVGVRDLVIERVDLVRFGAMAVRA